MEIRTDIISFPMIPGRRNNTLTIAEVSILKRFELRIGKRLVI